MRKENLLTETNQKKEMVEIIDINQIRVKVIMEIKKDMKRRERTATKIENIKMEVAIKSSSTNQNDKLLLKQI